MYEIANDITNVYNIRTKTKLLNSEQFNNLVFV